MTVKYRVGDVAKDLGVASKDIIALLAEYVDTPKKSVTTLTEEELNIIFEHYTQKNSVKSLDAYFAAADKRREQSAAAAKKAKEEEAEALRRQQEEAAAELRRLAEEAAAAEKAKADAEKAKADAEAKAKADAKKAEEEAKKAAEKKEIERRAAEKRAAEEKKAAEKKAAQPPVVIPPQQPKKKKEKNENAAPVAREIERRTVDTRAPQQVSANKYDEKYDVMAQSSNRVRGEGVAQKQKINQKSQQYKKPQRRRETEAERMRRIQLERQKKPVVAQVGETITVGEFASRLKVTSGEVIKKLMLMGVMASVNEEIDFDTAYLVAEELGAKVEREVVVTIEERIIDDSEDTAQDLQPRDPVVVVMGHVDHGKTSILDAIRKTNVTAGEAGGITQHIGAYRVDIGDGTMLTFLDTPGHAAFTSMRARGAQATDIAILVVAADDGIMPQTIEAINHAKAAGIDIVVAVNKMDKPTANPDRVLQQLTEHELVPEEWGGDVICVPVSALTGMGIDRLLESVQLVAEMKELRANPDRAAKGVVIEARLDKGRGPIATVLVQNGTLRSGDILVAGTAVGRVRSMSNERGEKIREAGPSVPVEIMGLDSVPTAGDVFNAVTDERLARELVEQRRDAAKEEQFKQYQKVTLDNLFDQMQQGEMKELNVIVKADVQGSVEAVRQSLEKLTNEEVRVRVIHGAVGAVSESDVMLANASNAIIVGFNVRPEPLAIAAAEAASVDMRMYRIIYDCIEEIESAMKGMLAPKTREVLHGRAEVREVYKISGVGTVAGCYITDGKVYRNDLLRVVREGIIIADDKMISLKRFKDDQREVAEGYECGIGLEKFNDIHVGDVFETYIIEEYRD
ncbi:MAG: translation initiation factor IF-2 [Ruminococcaceae bacterium]|nr:translation initiation factor IF-2 [Oscillospiraceae bacterium]